VTLLERIGALIGRRPSTTAQCIGCGPRAAEADARVMGGPGQLGICEMCTTEAIGLVGRTGPGTAYPDNENVTHCHFCGTERPAASGLVGWPRGAICRTCLDIAQNSFRKPRS
jgi:hypothetical protein